MSSAPSPEPLLSPDAQAAIETALTRGLFVLVLFVFWAAALGALIWLVRWRLDHHRGLRMQARVVRVEPTSLIQRYSVTERPTEKVTVVTATAPRGVAIDYKFPAGMFQPGQVIGVRQRVGNPHVVRMDGLEYAPSLMKIAAPGWMVLTGPVFMVLVATGQLP